MAKYYKNTFPTIFKSYSPKHYTFIYSDSERTQASYRAFTKSLFNFTITPSSNSNNDQIIQPFINLPLVSPFSDCPAYLNNHKIVSSVLGESYKFTQSSEFVQMLVDVTKRLGLNKPLTARKILVMWTACAFEQASNKISPWCSVSK